ncbi:MAG: double-strand break repair helicase AddA [Rhodobacter sp.]|nr:double-strand break repair helicase AddA [Paracoccaceae bacterium]MCC0077624.1 double-strand break repair helicase AddA [Rhodobacter sp.]
MDDATEMQIRAAEPAQSTWLSANAGSGKTKVLTDRVARLLLRGTPPQRILCLTYTKAAASEMQNRLFRRLGEWAMLPDAQLIAALRALGEPLDDDQILQKARRLFARAIETPGGLKIQTIHAFCSSLLRRFPLEAAVSPDFAEVEERSLQQLRIEVLDRIAQGPDARILQDLLARLDERSFGALLQDLGKYRDGFSGDIPELRAVLDLPPGFDEARLGAEVFDGGEGALFARIAPVLLAGSSTDQTLGTSLNLLKMPGLADLEVLESRLLTGSTAKEPFTAKVGKLGTKDTRARIAGDDLEALDDLARRVEGARRRRHALEALRRTEALHRFARLWLPAFDAAKARRGWLDFDDLIRLARRLLGVSAVAQWVLFKLDGGIDHILVDEAQDTSPEQWRVIDLLTQEFTAGQGARQEVRTIFVVGDRKQSIYSFQGADLRGFETTRALFADRLAQVGQGLAQLQLKHSFRSSDAVLRFVDTCFSGDDGAGGLGGTPEHLAFFTTKPGRVDLWPMVPKPGPDPDQPWFDPLDRPSQSHPDIVLAGHVAAEIRSMIDRGERIDDRDGPRPVHEGDFLILVQRRKVLFDALIRACKAQGLEIAGADRLVLTEELAIQDLIALLKFLALPEDDLSLAVALRSPLFGFDEDRLFRLAQGRGGAYLWAQLRADPACAAVRAVLDDLRGQVDFLRPYELIERILTRHDGRRRIRARFGAEVDEALEAFVDLALSYEQGHIPSLDGFLGWLLASDAEVKRQSESAGRRIRVMTVHGAKGLEAPIVILPDTAKRKQPGHGSIALLDGVPILRSAAAAATEGQSAADADAVALRQHEGDRLLYVALTRAESWLIVAGAGEGGDGSWYDKVAGAMEVLGGAPLETPAGPGLRYQYGDWPVPQPGAQEITQPLAVVSLPLLPVPRAAPGLVTPTALGGAKALPGEGADTETALARGRMVHRLLEVLPGVDPARRESAGRALLEAEEAGDAEKAACLDEALSVLARPELADILGAGALVEVALSGDWQGRAMWGIIDRLIVSPGRVLAVDFKSNRVVPENGAQVPEGLLRQMGAYAHLLAGLYPDRAVQVALLWTATGQVMPLDPGAVAAALGRAALDPEGASS